MEPNINSPAYYKNIYGVDDAVYWMCRKISLYFEDKNYSDLVDIIGICPIVAPKELIENGKWKENITYDLEYRLVIVGKQIEYDQYVNSDDEVKCKLMVGNILKSIKCISKKAKLDYNLFEKDLLEFVNYSKKDINI